MVLFPLKWANSARTNGWPWFLLVVVMTNNLSGTKVVRGTKGEQFLKLPGKRRKGNRRRENGTGEIDAGETTQDRCRGNDAAKTGIGETIQGKPMQGKRRKGD